MLMLGSRPELMPLIQEPVFPKVFSEVTFRHCENSGAVARRHVLDEPRHLHGQVRVGT